LSLGIRARVARHPPRKPPVAENGPSQIRALHRSRVDRLLAGRDGGRTRRLLTFLQGMTLADGIALLAHVKLDGWLDTDAEARQDALSIISNRIVHLRERAGLPPFDDPLPDTGDSNVFLKLRELFGDR
jgi:hypothetical protein